MYLSNEQIENICERVTSKLYEKLKNLATKKRGEEKVTVMHEKDSYKKYGDATEYGFTSWMDYCKAYSPYKESLKAIKRCPCCGKPMANADGAHVVNTITKEVFITPTCSACNTKAGQDEAFRSNHCFKVKVKRLTPFNFAELKRLRRSK